MYTEPKYFTPCRLSSERIYLHGTENFDVFDAIEAMRNEDFCLKTLSYGTGRPGYSESGNLASHDVLRPTLLLGKPQDFYKQPRLAISHAWQNSNRENLPKIYGEGVLSAFRATALLSVGGASIYGWSASLVAKSALLGAAFGTFKGVRGHVEHTVYYAHIVTTICGLHDMLLLMHTNQTREWMFHHHDILLQRRANPDVFEQATAELVRAGVTVPWARIYPPKQEILRQLPDVPPRAVTAQADDVRVAAEAA